MHIPSVITRTRHARCPQTRKFWNRRAAGIGKLEGLDGLRMLHTLDVGSNKLTRVECVSHLEHLEEFWVRPRTRVPQLLLLLLCLYVSGSLTTSISSPPSLLFSLFIHPSIHPSINQSINQSIYFFLSLSVLLSLPLSITPAEWMRNFSVRSEPGIIIRQPRSSSNVPKRTFFPPSTKYFSGSGFRVQGSGFRV